jgi:SAM-dependent methyltransferase
VIAGDTEAIAHYERLLDRFPPGQEPPLLIVIGLGGGHLLDVLERRAARTKVLAIEPVAAAVRPMFERRNWHDWTASGRLTILSGPDYTGAGDAWKLLDRRALDPPMIVARHLEDQFAEPVRGAKDIAARIVIGAQANETARREFAGRYLLNSIQNLPAICSEGDVTALAGLFTGAPCIVVAAGPSLDRNLKAIKSAEGRALIVAVDTAVRPLLAAGIRPHLAVAVDPSEGNARHLCGQVNTQGTWLVAEPSLHSTVFREYVGRAFTFRVSDHHPWPWLAARGLGRGTLRAWGSVLTTAFDLACHVGCDPIAFAGADLAYTDGLLYCRNTVYEPEWRHLETVAARAEEFRAFLDKKPTTRSPDIRGDAVLTAPHFVQFRDWLVARSLEQPCRIVNATGAGILHGGRISQGSLESLPLLAGEGHDLALRGQIARAWSASTARRLPAGRVLEDAAGSDGTGAPLEQWLDFAGDTASADQIAACLQTAIAGLAQQAPKGKADYLRMQRSFYDERATTRAGAEALIHANYEHASVQASSHQAHLLLDFVQRTYGLDRPSDVERTMRTASRLPRDIRALDVGCGIGRAMVPLVRAGLQVDGVDLSARMLALARENRRLKDCRFFLGSGNDCGDAPEGAYDLVYSHLCLQHICSREVRADLLAAFARALRPGGVVFIQLHYYPDRTAATVPLPHVPWSADDFNATGTNGEADVWPTPDELPLVLEDFSRHFQDLRLQFVDFPRTTPLFTEAYSNWFSHLLISGSSSCGLGARVYAPIERVIQQANVAAGVVEPV